MARTLTIVGLGGSVASVSRSRAALQTALDGAAAAGARTELLDIRQLDLPMYNPDDDEPTETASRLIETSHAADGMLWSSPMYQGTISGAFKNALDWLHVLGGREPPYLHDKVIGLISAAGGTQGLQAINTMEFATRALRAWAVPYVVPVAAGPASSTLRAGFRIRPSSYSSRRSAARSCASPSDSSPTSRPTARPNVRARRNGPRRPHSGLLLRQRASSSTVRSAVGTASRRSSGIGFPLSIERP